MGLIELIAVLSGVISIVLTIKQNVLCWVFGLISCVLLIVYFFNIDLYGQVILQLVAVYQCVHGFVRWGETDNKKITRFGFKKTLEATSVISIIGIIIGLIFIKSNGVIGILDVTGASIAILATYLLIYKKIEAWWLYMINNAIVSGICIYTESYYIVLLNVLYLVLSIGGYKEWKMYLDDI